MEKSYSGGKRKLLQRGLLIVALICISVSKRAVYLVSVET